ncbi:SubName: Full=Uncharacterized protein {ECO:0000313/EMBL:CCA68503.1} [Serendipita indica DSM 11827]|nr:SubName: Full=Uncharacterized protein {ECO:0000313/EMBL:CCA68503.1} [Serendipita indica DSM 11827]
MSDAKVVDKAISQRAKKPQKTKTVFKPVLDNPLTISWPDIPQNLQNTILASAIDLLGCLKDYHRQRGMHTKRSRQARRREILRTQKEIEEAGSRKRKRDDETSPEREKMELDPGPPSLAEPSSPPPLLGHVHFGLSEVLKLLERHIAQLRNTVANSKALDETATPTAILACRWDINPPQLFSHIPHLVASYNTLLTLYHARLQDAKRIPELKLVNLPKGAEDALSESIGLRRVSIVLVMYTRPERILKTNFLTHYQKSLVSPHRGFCQITTDGILPLNWNRLVSNS